VTKLLAAAAGALLGSAVAKELNKPAGQRTWHGTVAGVPYDFRPPTAEKIRQAFWDPDNPELFPPHVFGVGWSINLARLVALSQRSPAGGAAAGGAASGEAAEPAAGGAATGEAAEPAAGGAASGEAAEPAAGGAATGDRPMPDSDREDAE
jgi:hypothetical protein